MALKFGAIDMTLLERIDCAELPELQRWTEQFVMADTAEQTLR
ncbi:MAG: hypothetical protein ACE366_15205 [Bradymonadia bacterium]